MLVAPSLVSLLAGLTGGYAAGFLLAAGAALLPLAGLVRRR